ncbi:hypothetical protein J6590_015604 [Homalodisca vitripennis]|nr:hypothetical protein J6590_015604 [Homalodisca vitripennis]
MAGAQIWCARENAYSPLSSDGFRVSPPHSGLPNAVINSSFRVKGSSLCNRLPDATIEIISSWRDVFGNRLVKGAVVDWVQRIFPISDFREVCLTFLSDTITEILVSSLIHTGLDDNFSDHSRSGGTGDAGLVGTYLSANPRKCNVLFIGPAGNKVRVFSVYASEKRRYLGVAFKVEPGPGGDIHLHLDLIIKTLLKPQQYLKHIAVTPHSPPLSKWSKNVRKVEYEITDSNLNTQQEVDDIWLTSSEHVSETTANTVP